MMNEDSIQLLLDWYLANARDLPWRKTKDPYRIWVSEIMLQQTRVEAVRPYYKRFIEVLPDVQSLADCPEDLLLKLWEGLGYYSRVRNMQKAAGQIVKACRGEFPETYEQLRRLPGIGQYTAGAVASIAFGQPVPAVDGNALRVMCRLTGDRHNILSQSFKNEMFLRLKEIIPQEHPGQFNQAVMDLGAMVCLPKGNVRCGECPLAEYCIAGKEKLTDIIPVREKQIVRKKEEKTVLVIRDGQRTVLRKRPPRGLLAGMYEFPCLEGYTSADTAISWLKERGISPVQILPVSDARHIFSHKEWSMHGYMILAEELQQADLTDGLLAVEAARTEKEYPVPSAYKVYCDCLKIRTGKELFHEGRTAKE